MRITNSMLVTNMMRNMNNNLRRMDKVQNQMSTGRKFMLPSDDPIGVSKSLKLNTDIAKTEQYRRNLDDARSWLDVTEDAIHQMGEVLHRARELTVQASNGTNEVSDLKQISAEINQLRDQLIKISNQTYAGRSIFTGFKTDGPLLDANGNYKLTNYNQGTIVNPTTVTLNQNEISVYNVGVAEDISINTVGIRLFGKLDNGDLDIPNFNETSINGYGVDKDNKVATSDGADQSYLIALFDGLKNAMDTGDRDTINSTLGRIDTVMDNMLSVRAEIGAKSNRLELTSNRLQSEMINFTRLLSDNEDADMAEVIMRLNIEENIYRASLSAGARVIQPTLIDFLR